MKPLDPFTFDTVRLMVSYIRSDEQIARYVGCDADHVATVRRRYVTSKGLRRSSASHKGQVPA